MGELARLFGASSSAGGSVPWLSIIEYLSSFRKIDTSIICGLIEASPISPDDIGENMKEKIALRCLEELFDPNNSPRSVAPHDSRVIFDLSASCEDVLQQILREVPVSILKRGGPELLRWNVHPFIMHKRASLPNCALEQLKASMYEEMPISYEDENAPRWSDSSDDENGNQEVNSIPQVHEDDTEVLQDERHSLPSRRCRSDSIAGNLDNMYNDHQVNAKKFKQDATGTNQSVEHIPVLHGEKLPEDDPGKILKVTEIEDNNMGKGFLAVECDQDLLVASTTRLSNPVAHVELQGNQMEDAHNTDMMCRKKYENRPSGNVMMNESIHAENDALQKSSNFSGDVSEDFSEGFPFSTSNSTSTDKVLQNINPNEAKADVEHPCLEQMSEYEDERRDIALNKSLFSSSQCTLNQEPLRRSGWTGENLCLKCNKNGKVLVCNSNGCSNVFHESCLNSSARVYEKGDFYCPLCVCSVAISKYLKAKEETSLARKDLAVFMELCSKRLMEEESKLQSSARLNGDENLVGIQESLHQGETEYILISQNREVNHGASASCLDGNKLCIEEETCMGGAAFVQGQKNEEEEKLVHGLLSMRGHVHQQDQLSVHFSHSDDNPTSENVETIPSNQVEVEGEIVKEAAQHQITDPPQNPASALNSDGEESSTACNDKFIVSSYAVRSRNQETKYTFPPIPQMRRNRVPWTQNEEEMLRRGVEMFAGDGGAVPWKRVLEFGTSVFLKGRTPIDLKDKWRNMSKSSSRCKSSDVPAW